MRIFVNSRFAPSLNAGQWLVRRRRAEFVAAPPKRFAWASGFVLALTMACLAAPDNVVGPLNLLVCAACLVRLFFETALGICCGCRVCKRFDNEQARPCPGGVCEIVPAPGAGPGCPGVAHA